MSVAQADRDDRYYDELSQLNNDQGPGVPPEELDRLFRPFGRTRVRSTAGEKSTGLGLAIVKRIVEGHRGEIRVESGPEGGSVFVVTLPETGLEGAWPRS